MEQLIVVDRADRPLGTIEKLAGHVTPILHRAVSGFAFLPDGRLVVQRRAADKYHSGGMLANSCCSHPRPGETVLTCITRRSREELGLVADWRPFGTYRYRLPLPGGLWEHELVHLFHGTVLAACAPNPREVSEVLCVSPPDIHRLANTQAHLAPWFRLYLEDGLVEQALDAWAKYQETNSTPAYAVGERW